MWVGFFDKAIIMNKSWFSLYILCAGCPLELPVWTGFAVVLSEPVGDRRLRVRVITWDVMFSHHYIWIVMNCFTPGDVVVSLLTVGVNDDGGGPWTWDERRCWIPHKIQSVILSLTWSRTGCTSVSPLPCTSSPGRGCYHYVAWRYVWASWVDLAQR